MNKFFKPLSKKDAQVIAVIFGLAFIYLVISFIKTLLSGTTFDDAKSDLILIAFVGIVEWAMVNIALSKDKKSEEKQQAEEAAAADAADVKAAEARLDKDQAEMLAAKYEDDTAPKL